MHLCSAYCVPGIVYGFILEDFFQLQERKHTREVKERIQGHIARRAWGLMVFLWDPAPIDSSPHPHHTHPHLPRSHGDRIQRD